MEDKSKVEYKQIATISLSWLNQYKTNIWHLVSPLNLQPKSWSMHIFFFCKNFSWPDSLT